MFTYAIIRYLRHSTTLYIHSAADEKKVACVSGLGVFFFVWDEAVIVSTVEREGVKVWRAVLPCLARLSYKLCTWC